MADLTGPAQAAVAGVCALFGLVVGSFLNVVIHRVPVGESLVRPGSRCPHCGRHLTPGENIPVVSWLIQRGRCRGCQAPISRRYPAIELLTGLLFAGMGLRFGPEPELVGFCTFAAALVALAAIDLQHRRLPTPIVYVATGIGGASLLLAALVHGDSRRAVNAVLSGVAAWVAFRLIRLASPRGMGRGDVRLAGMIGLHLGWLSPAQAAVGIFLGFVAGAVLGGVLMATGRRGRKDAMPFGPFLALGALGAVFWGGHLVGLWLPGAG